MLEKIRIQMLKWCTLFDIRWMIKLTVFFLKRGYTTDQIDNILHEIVWLRAYIFVYGTSGYIIWRTFT